MKVAAGRQEQGREPVGKYVQYIFIVGLIFFIVSHTRAYKSGKMGLLNIFTTCLEPFNSI